MVASLLISFVACAVLTLLCITSAAASAAQHGFGMIDRLGGIKAIQSHVAVLTDYLYNQLSSLRHSNGRPMLQIFGKHHFANHREVQVGSAHCSVGWCACDYHCCAKGGLLRVWVSGLDTQIECRVAC